MDIAGAVTVGGTRVLPQSDIEAAPVAAAAAAAASRGVEWVAPSEPLLGEDYARTLPAAAVPVVPLAAGVGVRLPPLLLVPAKARM